MTNPKFWQCPVHGPAKPNAWGCPECVRELRGDADLGDRLCDASTRLMSALHVERITEDELAKAGDDMVPAFETALAFAHEHTGKVWRELATACGEWTLRRSDSLPTPRFARTSCSQCGGEFGPGDSGFSHCSDHTRHAETVPCKECCGKGFNEGFRLVAGHYNEGEVFRLDCELCCGTGQMTAYRDEDAAECAEIDAADKRFPLE